MPNRRQSLKYKWVNSNGTIRMEKKEEAKRRLGKSPDLTDSLTMTYVQEEERQEAFVVVG